MKSTLLIALLGIYVLFTSSSKADVKKRNVFTNTITVLANNHVSGEKEKTYCSPYAKTKYKLLINKDKIRITRLYKEYKDVFIGVIKIGKIYSNDPDEKNFKPVWGKLYKLDGKNFGILNIENGDYEWFSERKE
ncbi:MAG: hypothetical protein WKF91_20525 [Segetibacter sp.]